MLQFLELGHGEICGVTGEGLAWETKMMSGEHKSKKILSLMVEADSVRGAQ